MNTDANILNKIMANQIQQHMSKDKNHVMDVEKAFSKIQHCFMMKALRKLKIEGMYMSIIKAIYDKPISQHHTYWEKMETILPKVRNKTRVHTLLTPTQHSPGFTS
jgi:hypothetical protein